LISNPPSVHSKGTIAMPCPLATASCTMVHPFAAWETL
jgi:hypothetical protein